VREDGQERGVWRRVLAGAGGGGGGGGGCGGGGGGGGGGYPVVYMRVCRRLSVGV